MAADWRPAFKNDHGLPEIRIGSRRFECIGASPPDDHPHIYLEMASADAMTCPYCGTRFLFDPHLGPWEADPPDSFHESREQGGNPLWHLLGGPSG